MRGRHVVALLALGGVLAQPALAQDRYDDGQSNPLRIVAYLVAPAGFLAEWLVTRPLFRVVSQEDTAPVFAYTPQGGFDYETYEEGLSTGVTFDHCDVKFNGGGGIFNDTEAEDPTITGNKVTNTYLTLDTSQYLPTFATATMFNFRVLLCNGRFTDPFGVTRNLLLMWHGVAGQPFWSVASQNLELTNIGYYEQDSIMTPYGTDGTSLFQLFAQPDPTLKKRLSTKALRGNDAAKKIAWAVTLRAMTKSVDEIGAAIPRRRARRIADERLVVHEQPFPHPDGAADVEWKRQLVRL